MENSGNEASTPDTIKARSFEDDKKILEVENSGVNVVEESNLSLDAVSVGDDMVVGSVESSEIVGEEKKKGRFGALKSTFKKDSGFFKIKKKKSFESEPSLDLEEEDTDRDVGKKSNIRLPEFEASRSSPLPQPPPTASEPPAKKMMKKKKSGLLVRKLSLNKFRLGSSDQETRHTPEGGDSSQSQSSQESAGRLDSPVRRQGRLEDKPADLKPRGRERKLTPASTPTLERRSQGPPWGQDREKGVVAERRFDEARRRQTSSEKLPDKPVSTVTVIQRRNPSITIRSSFSPDSEKQEDVTKSSASVSTLPYSLSKWPENRGNEIKSTIPKKPKLSQKSDSESCLIIPLPGTPPTEIRRKLSLLEEKRAIFQGRYFESSERVSRDTSRDTVIAAVAESLDSESPQGPAPRRPSRPIPVKTIDSFSTTFDRTFDDDTDADFLEARSDLGDGSNDIPDVMAHVVDSSDGARGDSASTHNNAPSSGVGEKREHLYKILVIGELGAGKTSLIKRYVHQFFSQHYRATIGVDFALKVLNWDPHTIIRLQLWDIAGQERFGNMTRVYYKEAVGAFIVFDVTRSATLDAVVKWKQDLDSKVQLPDGSPIPCVLLANKCDQQKEGLVNSPGKMDDYCKDKNFAGWFETSAKENINIEEAARFLVNRILQNDQLMKGNGAQDQIDGERFALNQSPTSSKKSCSC